MSYRRIGSFLAIVLFVVTPVFASAASKIAPTKDELLLTYLKQLVVLLTEELRLLRLAHAQSSQPTVATTTVMVKATSTVVSVQSQVYARSNASVQYAGGGSSYTAPSQGTVTVPVTQVTTPVVQTTPVTPAPSVVPVPTMSLSASAQSTSVGTPVTLTASFTPGTGDTITNTAINWIRPQDTETGAIITGAGEGQAFQNPVSFTFTPQVSGSYVFKPEVKSSKYPYWQTSDQSKWITVNIAPSVSIDPRISVSNVSGLYPNYGSSYLEKSSNDALDLGFQTMEIYLSPEICWTPGYKRINGIYQTLDWCATTDPYVGYGSLRAGSLRGLAQDPRYQSTFSLPFKTFILTTESNAYTDVPFSLAMSRAPYTQAQLDAIYKDFFDLTTYLDSTYANSGKTFIIQTPNEIDWEMIGSSDANASPSIVAVHNAINYWNQIQNAINDARRIVPPIGMHVYGGCELNLVQKGMKDGTATTAVNSVLPATYCDLYGYSAWDTVLANPTTNGASSITPALDYIASKAPPSAAFGHKNVYLSELGLPERQYGNASGPVVAAYAQQALNWGTPYVNLWTLYDNECDSYLPTTNGGCSGFWMRKPDMSLSQTYQSVLQTFGQK